MKNEPKIYHILFFGFISDHQHLLEVFSSEENPQVSAIKFQQAIIEAISKNGAAVRILSTLPISSFPRNRTLLVRSRDFSLGEANGRLMGFINLPVVNLFSRLISSFGSGRRELRTQPKVDAILVYALHTPYVLAAVILKYMFGVKLGVLIPDLPLNMNGRNEFGIKALAKRLDNWILRNLSRHIDVSFPITKYIAEDWLPEGIKFEVIEGIANSNVSPRIKTREENRRKKILYAGTFSHLSSFVRMFSERPEIPADLVFVGGGPDRAQIEMAAQVDSRISVKPFLHGREYAEEVANADFLLNARDPNWRGSRYSFPSKLFEYMSLEVPILSTRMAGIPDEYFRCFFCIHDNDPEKFAVSLLEALNASDAELASRIAVGRKIVTKHKSPEAVGATLLYALRET